MDKDINYLETKCKKCRYYEELAIMKAGQFPLGLVRDSCDPPILQGQIAREDCKQFKERS